MSLLPPVHQAAPSPSRARPALTSRSVFRANSRRIFLAVQFPIALLTPRVMCSSIQYSFCGLVNSARTRLEGASGGSQVAGLMFLHGCSFVGAPSSRGRGVAVFRVSGAGAGAGAGIGMGSGRGGSGATWSSDDSFDPVSVSSTSGPNLYTTSSSAIVRASSSASLMHPYC
jgi:hypothetical protein